MTTISNRFVYILEKGEKQVVQVNVTKSSRRFVELLVRHVGPGFHT